MQVDTAYFNQYARAAIEWTKRFGFNGARKHQKIEDPRYLYWADRLGLLALVSNSFLLEITSKTFFGGDTAKLDTDEGVRAETTAESLAGLRPAFDKAGNITAGNASQISDGAAALVLMNREKAEAQGITPLARVLSYGTVAGPDGELPGPAPRCRG